MDASFVAGAASAVHLIAAGFSLWKSRAKAENPVPPAAVAAAAPALGRLKDVPVAAPPAASEKIKEEKRFGRADKDKDGRITLDELYQPRRKAFAKLDTNGDGRLGFEQWARTAKSSSRRMPTATGADAARTRGDEAEDEAEVQMLTRRLSTPK